VLKLSPPSARKQFTVTRYSVVEPMGGVPSRSIEPKATLLPVAAVGSYEYVKPYDTWRIVTDSSWVHERDHCLAESDGVPLIEYLSFMAVMEGADIQLYS
jgi:hypothetical protein